MSYLIIILIPLVLILGPLEEPSTNKPKTYTFTDCSVFKEWSDAWCVCKRYGKVILDEFGFIIENHPLDEPSQERNEHNRIFPKNLLGFKGREESGGGTAGGFGGAIVGAKNVGVFPRFHVSGSQIEV